MNTELKQNGSTTWVNVGDNIVIVSGSFKNCEWKESKRIVKEIKISQFERILILA